MTIERPNWHEYYMNMAEEAAKRSTCLRRQVGAIAVSFFNRVIGTGYNGPPVDFDHCTPETCYRTANNIPSGTQLDLCYAIHAEANLVVQLGDDLRFATVVVTNQPCVSCFKLMHGAGVSRIMWKGEYPDSFALEMMKKTGRIYTHSSGFMYWDRKVAG